MEALFKDIWFDNAGKGVKQENMLKYILLGLDDREDWTDDTPFVSKNLKAFL